MIIRPGITILLILLVKITIHAQLGPTPTPTPRPGTRQTTAPRLIRDNPAYERLEVLHGMQRPDPAANHPLLDRKTGIYRKPGRDETEVLAVAEAILGKYASFLRSPDAGVVKLNGDASCLSNSEIIIATENCSRYRFPGAGVAYSFRIEGYRMPRLADLILFNGAFRSDGVLQHVAMVELGDRPVDDVTLDSSGMKYLVEIQPIIDREASAKFDEDLARGITANGFLYRMGHPVKPDTTYALRSIAYRGKYIRTVDGIPYDELDYDKRRDVIVAFRVVEIDAQSNVTILWKRLKDVEAPKLITKN
jgi:hypothetical protein